MVITVMMGFPLEDLENLRYGAKHGLLLSLFN